MIPLAVGVGEVLWDLLPQGKEIGGAPANFAYHALQQGAAAAVLSRVGSDRLGDELVERLTVQGLDTSCIARDPVHATGTVTVELDAEGRPRFSISPDAAWDAIELGEHTRRLARRASLVCFGSLAQRNPVSRASIAGFLEATGEECLRIFDVNLRRPHFSPAVIEAGLARCNCLKLNEEELPVVARMLSLVGDPRTALESLLKRFSLRAIALTLSDRGCLLALPGIFVEHGGIKPERLVSTVGAGDAFTAVFGLGLIRGRAPEEIAERANRLASYVCTQPGAMPPIPADLRP